MSAIATLVERLEGGASASPREDARELVREVLAFHRDGLAKIVAAVDAKALEDLATDPLVRSVLELHDLAPPEPDPSLLPVAKLLSKSKSKKSRGHEDVTTCELCSVDAGERHAHLVELETDTLRCMCIACGMVMENQTAKYRRVPDRVARVSSLATADAAWCVLGVPVGIAFFVKHGRTGEIRAHYPGAVGAVRAAIAPDAFAALEAAHPELATLTDDVEALVVSRVEGAREHWIVGIDRAYELAGRVRTHWKGFTGGEEVRRELSAFFDALAGEARS